MKKLEVDPGACEPAGTQDGILVAVVQHVWPDPVAAHPVARRGVFEGRSILCIAPANLAIAGYLGQRVAVKKFAELAKFWMLLLAHSCASEQHPLRGIDQTVIHDCPQSPLRLRILCISDG